MSYISRKVAQSAIVVGLLGTPVMALAADFAPPPVGKAVPYAAPLQYRWDGFYVGINGGGAFGSTSWDVAAFNSFNTAGWMFGATVGYNMQFTRLVIGAEADFDYVDVSGRSTLGGCGAAGCTLTNRYLATGRGRIGYALDRFFPYFTGGIAYGELRTARTGFPSSSRWHLGYTVGAGLESAVFDSWTVKDEYLFVDFGHFTCSPVCGAAPNNRVFFYENVWRLGLNYRF
jgi:outer membrane immunogenic protein